MDSAASIPAALWQALDLAQQVPWHVWVLVSVTGTLVAAVAFYFLIFVVAPVPRPPRPEEETYITVDRNGKVTTPIALSRSQRTHIRRTSISLKTDPAHDKHDVAPPQVYVSLVVPAYNEEKRIGVMLEEAIEVLEREHGTKAGATAGQNGNSNGTVTQRRAPNEPQGWEIIIVSDGSTDGTKDVCLDFARRYPGDRIRIVELVRNRGKGGAVTHGLRHVRGVYSIFADADGASRFSDLKHLIAACKKSQDAHGRAVAVGSRAHLVGSEAVVKRSMLRNFLMHSFHLLLRLLTPPATSRIKDTQCGFKLFSRASLPYIVPHMHSEGWIFDVEMLMLAEGADIPMVEVPIGWKEVGGSKLNVIWDSLGMAWGLAVLRAAWAIGVYRV